MSSLLPSLRARLQRSPLACLVVGAVAVAEVADVALILLDVAQRLLYVVGLVPPVCS